MHALKAIFYIVGIIFFIIIIIAAWIFIRKTMQTADSIREVLTSEQVERLIMQARDAITSHFR